MKQLLSLLLAIIFLLTWINLQAQNYRLSSRDRYMTAGAWLGGTNYFGDLAPEIGRFSTDLRLIGMAGGGLLTQKITANLSARFTLGVTNIRGDDAISADPNDASAIFRYARNLHFRNRIIESSIVMMYDFLKSEGRFWRRKDVSPYVFAGLGLIYSNPQARTPEDMGRKWIDLQPLATEGKHYSRTTLIFPLGGGVRFKVADRVDVGVEMSLRVSMTNYLDDVSGNYVSPSELRSDLAIRMADKSGELNSASGKPRNIARLNEVFGNFVTATTPSGQTYQRLIGYGESNEIRGKSPVDMYVVTSVYASYVLNIKRYMPKFGGRTGGVIKKSRYSVK
ncbi:MAG: DUF6089 family protein [Microscillaceae bacterium]|nr:DUF6089 family protein [Microscillaceae bacterium]MDW8460681.1 DUF6089 family protein [Cytophagales bacterium]